MYVRLVDLGSQIASLELRLATTSSLIHAQNKYFSKSRKTMKEGERREKDKEREGY